MAKVSQKVADKIGNKALTNIEKQLNDLQQQVDILSRAIGANGQVQYVKNGMLASSTGLTWDDKNNKLVLRDKPNQSDNMQEWRDSNGDILAQIQANGRIYTTAGVKSDAITGGGSLMLWADGGVVVEHSFIDGSGNFDYTGGTYEEQFTDTTNSPFTQADADNHNWIIIRSGPYRGAMATIETYISASVVVLHTMGWDFDLTGVDYMIVQEPKVVIGDGNHIEFHTGATGHFDIHANDFVGGNYTMNAVEIEMEAAEDGVRSLEVENNSNGYTETVTIKSSLNTGALPAGDRAVGIFSNIDTSDAVDADSSTRVAAFVAGAVNGSDATKIAFSVLGGFDEALRVVGGSAYDMAYGYDVTGGVVTDRVTGTPQAGTAFLSSSTSNITLMTNDNDYYLIGDDNIFEVIDLVLSTPSNKDCELTFEYSTGNDTWSTLTLEGNNINGLQSSGQIVFTAPGDWAKGNQAESAADITSAYYVKITRTRTNNIPVLPVESYFQLYSDAHTGLLIRGDGTIRLSELDDGVAPNSSLYYSTTASKAVWKDSGGTVNNLY